MQSDCYSPVVHVTSAHAGVAFSKIFDGDCADGNKLRMYDGGGDNPGFTPEEQVQACSRACQTKKLPADKEKSWSAFGVAKGFAIIPTGKHAGRCDCESAGSSACKRTSNSYRRYDWISRGQ